MITEHEIKILDIEVEEAKARLDKLGATFMGTKNFRRYVYDAKPMSYERWLRLRSDGEKTQLTFKHIIDESSVDGVKEREVTVDDFDMTNLLLNELGYVAKAYQENIRHSYRLNDCDVEVDERPGIPTYIEIEGPSTEKVEKTLAMLDYPDNDTTSDNTTKIYRRYGIEDLEAIEVLSFETMKK